MSKKVAFFKDLKAPCLLAARTIVKILWVFIAPFLEAVPGLLAEPQIGRWADGARAFLETASAVAIGSRHEPLPIAHGL